MFPLVREAVAAVLPAERLRYVGFSHFEADEWGSLNEPTTLACMHGSAWTGDGAGLIRELAGRLEVGEHSDLSRRVADRPSR